MAAALWCGLRVPGVLGVGLNVLGTGSALPSSSVRRLASSGEIKIKQGELGCNSAPRSLLATQHLRRAHSLRRADLPLMVAMCGCCFALLFFKNRMGKKEKKKKGKITCCLSSPRLSYPSDVVLSLWREWLKRKMGGWARETSPKTQPWRVAALCHCYY